MNEIMQEEEEELERRTMALINFRFNLSCYSRMANKRTHTYTVHGALRVRKTSVKKMR